MKMIMTLPLSTTDQQYNGIPAKSHPDKHKEDIN